LCAGAQSRGLLPSVITTAPTPRETRTAFARQRRYPSTAPGRHLPVMPILLVTRDEIPDPNALRIATILNGAQMQNETTADMIFDVPRLIES
jgi:2-keto-4-pentenoate hydratase/2-oxohepta-3-ene-1,7-dioic acid hydratase in catechol pathway